MFLPRCHSLSDLTFVSRLCVALIALPLLAPGARAVEPIQPLPLEVAYDRDKARLGKRLFFDVRLSADRSVSCATCHDPDAGGAEPRPVSTGVHARTGEINAPTVFNAYFNFRQFWNGRAADLKEQAQGPIHNPVEMGISSDVLVERLNADSAYRADVKRIYGAERIVIGEVFDAIAEFEKALFTPNARIDRYLRGELELQPLEKEGYLLFKSLGCASCHNGVNIGGNSFQYLGAVIPIDDLESVGDLYSITGDPFDRNRFKVPSLRNIVLTGPYLHDGSAESLAAVLDTMAYHNLGFRLSNDEVIKIIAFLHTLTGDRPAILDEP